MSNDENYTNKNAPIKDRLMGAAGGALNGWKEGGEGLASLNPLNRATHTIGGAIFGAAKPFNKVKDPARQTVTRTVTSPTESK